MAEAHPENERSRDMSIAVPGATRADPSHLRSTTRDDLAPPRFHERL
jgi:hypothetical protein